MSRDEKKQKKQRSVGKVCDSAAQEAGMEMNPLDLPDDEEGEPDPGKPRDVPIGRPVRPGEYQRLKEDAARRSQTEGTAQEDPSAGPNE
jgi:hypothetical protein